MNRSAFILLVLAFLGGGALMMMEIILPKISMIWFGNLLEVWSAMLIGALFSMSVGYWIGAKRVKSNRPQKMTLIICYVIAATCFFVLPNLNGYFELFLAMNSGLGSLIASLIILLPSIGALALTSPILVDFFNREAKKKGLNASLIFGMSTIAGVLMILISGFYLMPYLGIAFASQLMGGLLVINALLTLSLPSKS